MPVNIRQQYRFNTNLIILPLGVNHKLYNYCSMCYNSNMKQNINPHQLHLTPRPEPIAVERSELDDRAADNGYTNYYVARRQAGSVAVSTEVNESIYPTSPEPIDTPSPPARAPRQNENRKNGRNYVNRQKLGHRGKRIADGPPKHIKPHGRIGM